MMDGVTSLLIDCKGEKIVLSAGHDTTFEYLHKTIVAKWPNLGVGGYKLRYSIKESDDVVNCTLENDVEVQSMHRLAQALGAKLVVGNVIETSSPSKSASSMIPVPEHDQYNSTSSPLTFSQLSGKAFANSTNIASNKATDIEARPAKKNRTAPPAYEMSLSYPVYDVCPRHEGKHLLSDHWQEGITGIGQVFKGGAKDFRDKLAKYSMMHGFKFHYYQNMRHRIYVVCKKKHTEDACKWFIRANQVKGGDGELRISDAELNHTCEVVVGSVVTERMSAELMSSLIESDVRENPKMSGKDVKRLLKKAYGIDISYKQAWRALECARDKIFGSFESSFDQLRWYLHVLLSNNPGSVAKLEQNANTGRFERAFIAFKASLDGFKFCRPMLFVDGTFMRGRWKGVVLAATAKDGNDGLFPVAFAMVQSESKDNWIWFFDMLNKHCIHDKPIYYISDRGSGLLPAFEQVWKEPLNFYCLVHLFNNLKGLFGNSKTEGEKIKMCGLLKRCAYAPTRKLFDIEMAEFIKVGGEKARDWIQNIDKEKWTVAYAPDNLRYGEMTSNAVESFNHWIKDARALPITFMVDCIRIGIMRWFVERRDAANRWTSRLTETMQNEWNERVQICRTWGVLKGPSGKFEIFSTPNAVVDMEKKHCSCYQWQVTGFPCVHAVAVIIKNFKGLSGIVHDYYFKSSYLSTYAGDIHSVPETEKYEFINEPGLNPILPPERIAEKGRPQQKRIPSFGEFRKKKALVFKKKKQWVCRKCNKEGRHDEVTCALAL